MLFRQILIRLIKLPELFGQFNHDIKFYHERTGTVKCKKTFEGFLADTFHESNGFDDLFMKYMRERKVPGANVAVAKKGKIIIKKGNDVSSTMSILLQLFI